MPDPNDPSALGLGAVPAPSSDPSSALALGANPSPPTPTPDPSGKKGSELSPDEQKKLITYQMTAVLSALTDKTKFQALSKALEEAAPPRSNFEGLNKLGIFIKTPEDYATWFPGAHLNEQQIIWNLLTYYLGDPNDPNKIGLDEQYARLAGTGLRAEQRSLLYQAMVELENSKPTSFAALQSAWDKIKFAYVDRNDASLIAIIRNFENIQKNNTPYVMHLFQKGSFNGELNLQHAEYSLLDVIRGNAKTLKVTNFALNQSEFVGMMQQFGGGGGDKFSIVRDGKKHEIKNHFAGIKFHFKDEKIQYGLLLVQETVDTEAGPKVQLVEYKVKLDADGNPTGEKSPMTNGDHILANMDGEYENCGSLSAAVLKAYDDTDKSVREALNPDADKTDRTAVQATVTPARNAKQQKPQSELLNSVDDSVKKMTKKVDNVVNESQKKGQAAPSVGQQEELFRGIVQEAKELAEVVDRELAKKPIERYERKEVMKLLQSHVKHIEGIPADTPEAKEAKQEAIDILTGIQAKLIRGEIIELIQELETYGEGYNADQYVEKLQEFLDAADDKYGKNNNVDFYKKRLILIRDEAQKKVDKVHEKSQDSKESRDNKEVVKLKNLTTSLDSMDKQEDMQETLKKSVKANAQTTNETNKNKQGMKNN